MKIKTKTLERIYDLCKHEHRGSGSANMRNACLLLEKELGLEAFSFLGNKELAAHHRRTHTTLLNEMGFIQAETGEPQGEHDNINRYPSGR